MSWKVGSAAAVLVLLFLSGCSYVRHRKAIDPPMGCRSCHAGPVEGNWHVLFKPATIHSETDSGHPVSIGVTGDSETRPMSSCFICHHAPDRKHLLYKGYYEH